MSRRDDHISLLSTTANTIALAIVGIGLITPLFAEVNPNDFVDTWGKFDWESSKKVASLTGSLPVSVYLSFVNWYAIAFGLGLHGVAHLLIRLKKDE